MSKEPLLEGMTLNRAKHKASFFRYMREDKRDMKDLPIKKRKNLTSFPISYIFHKNLLLFALVF